jgi:hypothetical protein
MTGTVALGLVLALVSWLALRSLTLLTAPYRNGPLARWLLGLYGRQWQRFYDRKAN